MDSGVEPDDAETGLELSVKIIYLAKKPNLQQSTFTPEVCYSIFQRVLSSQLILLSYNLKKIQKATDLLCRKTLSELLRKNLFDGNYFFPNFVSKYFNIFVPQKNSVEKLFLSHYVQKMKN